MDPNKRPIDLSKGSVTPAFPDLNNLPVVNETKQSKVAHKVWQKSTPRNRSEAVSIKAKETKKEKTDPPTDKISNVKTAALPKAQAVNKTEWKTVLPAKFVIEIENLKKIVSDQKLANIANLYFSAEEMVDLIDRLVSQMTIKDKKELEKYGEFLLDCLAKPHIATEFNDEKMIKKLKDLFVKIGAIDFSYKSVIEHIPNIISLACTREQTHIPKDGTFIAFSDILPQDNDNLTKIDQRAKLIAEELRNTICYECSGMGTKEVFEYLKDQSVNNKCSKFVDLAISLSNKVSLSIIESDRIHFKDNIEFFVLMVKKLVNRKDYANAYTIFLALQSFDQLIKTIQNLSCKFIYEELSLLFSEVGSYNALRDAIENDMNNGISESIFPIQIVLRDALALKDSNPLFDKNNDLNLETGQRFYDKIQSKLDAIPKLKQPFKTNLIDNLDDQPVFDLAGPIAAIANPSRFFIEINSINKQIEKDIDKLDLNNLDTYLPIIYKKINICYSLIKNWFPPDKIEKKLFEFNFQWLMVEMKKLENFDLNETKLNLCKKNITEKIKGFKTLIN